ncbi:MAG: DUF3565 domain-containing protein [Actinomycetota bacterium]|nr:DUF3565 domain-containing protein [Actinomycetota bacterium]
MDRAITGLHEDEVGDWVAELSCGHRRHVGRVARLGPEERVPDPDACTEQVAGVLGCPLCDRMEPPDGLRLERTSPEWDERTLPAGLRRAHRLAPGTWATITVRSGALRLQVGSEPPISVELRPGPAVQHVPPEVLHEIEPLGPVRFVVAFHSLAAAGEPEREVGDGTAREGGPRGRVTGTDERPASRAADPYGDEEDEGGDPACWAALVCPECGTLSTDGSHRPGCAACG